MRFLFLLLLFPLFSVAQFDTTKFYRSPNYGDLFRRAKINQLMIPSDTTTNKVGVAQIGQRLFLYNVNKWVEVGNFDSTSLSNRINLKINISDTAAMLNAYKHWIIGYLKGTDTVALSNRINLKFNISDTASMLLSYRHWIQGYLKNSDTVSLSNRINTKLNISDTASMLNVYKHWLAGYLKGTDTLAMLNGRLSSITLNTSGTIHTTPTTFTRVGGAWSGTLNLATQSANTVFAAPNGSSGVPSFRSLLSNDIPNLAWSKITSGLPTTLAGYGITNGAATNAVNTFTTRNNFTSITANKDSIPITTGRIWGFVLDTTDNLCKRQQLFTLPSLTSGSVLFSNGTTIAQDNANFFWDNSTATLRLGNTGSTGLRFNLFGVFNQTLASPNSTSRTLARTGSSVNITETFDGSQYTLNHSSGGGITMNNASRVFIRAGGEPALFIDENRNVQIANGGLFLLGGFRLDVQGTARVTGKISQPTTANSPMGTATLVNGTVTINNTLATTGCYIRINYRTGTTPSTTTSTLVVTTVTNNTSFVVTAYTPGTVTTNTSDNNVIEYQIFN